MAVELQRWREPATVFTGGFAHERHVFWLDAGPDAVRGWSWIGTGVPDAPEHVRATVCAGETPAEPGRLRGGWVGWVGYDAEAGRAGAPAASDDDGVPQELWLRIRTLVAFDHARRRVWALAADEHSARRLAMRVAGAGDRYPAPAPVAPTAATVAAARHTPEEYAGLIERCREAIRDGDAYQLCLTTRFAVDTVAVDVIEAYRRLRSMTPAHHGGLIRSGDAALLSASPERFLEVEEGTVRTRPIKGTRPRGADAGADAALAAELVTSEKERAENVMIVDLMRNDLSRVCAPGTVAVEGLLEVESYPAVHQLVSTVSGRLRPGTRVDDLLEAAFPAGSMTGAPKLSAMSILHRLERRPRGVFSGCFGWVGDDGGSDLAMVIRSIVWGPRGAYVGAGGGITWRSDAAAEVAEVAVKARAPLAALGAVLPPGW